MNRREWKRIHQPETQLLPIYHQDEEFPDGPHLRLSENDGHGLKKFESADGACKGWTWISGYSANFYQESILAGIRPTWDWVHG